MVLQVNICNALLDLNPQEVDVVFALRLQTVAVTREAFLATRRRSHTRARISSLFGVP